MSVNWTHILNYFKIVLTDKADLDSEGVDREGHAGHEEEKGEWDESETKEDEEDEAKTVTKVSSV